MTDMKKCARCKQLQPLTEYNKEERNGDGLQSYCKPCNILQNRESQIRHKKKYYHRDGFATEDDHFNYALRQYAEVFNMPQLLKYQTNTGSIPRYSTNGKRIN